MSESGGNPHLAPRAQFEQLLPYAHNNLYGTALWFGYKAYSTIVHEVWQLSHVEQLNSAYVETAASPRRNEAFRYQYLCWDTANPIDIQTTSLERRVPDNPEPFASGFAPQVLGVPQLCAHFLHNTDSADDMGRFTEAYLDWAAQYMSGPYSRTSYSVLFRLALSGVVMEEKPLANASSRVNKALAVIPLKAPHFKRVSASLGRALGGMLAGRFPTSVVTRLPRSEIKKHRTDILAAANTLDAIGVLPPDFWAANDVVRGSEE